MRGDWACRNKNMRLPSNVICPLLIKCVCLSVSVYVCCLLHNVRHIQLIDDKKVLSEKCEKLVKEVKELDKKCSQKVKALEEK